MASTYTNCDKKELIAHIMNSRYFGVENIEEILQNPNTDREVFSYLVKYTFGKENILFLLQSPYLNSEFFSEICIRRIDDPTIIPDLLENPYLTQELYEKILARRPSNMEDLLLNSRFANEHTCMVLMENRVGSGVTNDVILKVIRSPHFTINVFNKYLNNIYGNDELLFEALKKRVATPELITKILDRCIKYPSTYIKSVHYIFENYQCDYKYLKTYIQLDDANMDYLISSGVADIDTIKKLLEDGNDKIAIRVINSGIMTEEILLQIINRDYTKTPYSTVDANNKIYREILKDQNLSEKVLCAILDKKPSNTILDLIAQHPSAGTDTKASIIINKQALTEADLDTLFALPGLTEEHLNELIQKQASEMVFKRVMDSPFISQKLYRQILANFIKVNNANYISGKSFSRGVNIEFLMELIDRDLDENNLDYLLANVCGDYTVVKKVLHHPSAGLDICKRAHILSDRMEESKRNEIVELASKLKHKIISETFEIEEEEDVTDILRLNVEDGMSTMLWGPSGVGKSSRVFEIDPTATLLILKNGMLPEEVIGGKEPNGQPGEIYPPHWYVVLCEKCRREPNRKHILFIDEFTNVNDTIKNLAWEIVGNRLVNGHEEWPLPENCSLVVAGNRPEESSAVRIDASGGVMPAPLHNRIDSMIEIQFNVDEWQKWALETDPTTGRLRIHPIVLSFCAAHADKVMFTQFNPEDVTQPFLTPRKWEQLSAAIYRAEERGANHHVSYARIRSMLGNTPICNAFIEHYERLPIDMDKIVMGEYTEEDFPSLEDKMYALGIIIAQYNGDQETIESFILECLGDEFLSVYNNMRNERKAVLEATDTNVSMNGGKK
ncbi:MAG: ATP-binding protein [Bacilli bacterium]|nr:ATP-binding protein [Bacilli bacterium]